MTPPSRRVCSALVIFLLTAVLAGGAAGSVGVPAQLADDDDPDAIVLDVYLPGDDTAEWTIEHRYRLATEEDEAAFEELEAAIEDEEAAYVERFRDRMNRTVDAAAAATGREMAIANVSIETETRALPREYGIVRYTFEWHGFAVVEDNQILVGEAISGLFLYEDSTLRISWSDEYVGSSITPEPTAQGETAVRWSGPKDFNSDEPRVTLGGEPHPILQLLGTAGVAVLLLVGFLVLVGAGVGIGRWWLLQERDRTTEAQDESPTAPELLSNEERVLQLLEAEGGRMRQQEVVDRLGWSDAKTSQVVSTLRSDGAVESFRLGRENVLSLPQDETDGPGRGSDDSGEDSG